MKLTSVLFTLGLLVTTVTSDQFNFKNDQFNFKSDQFHFEDVDETLLYSPFDAYDFFDTFVYGRGFARSDNVSHVYNTLGAVWEKIVELTNTTDVNFSANNTFPHLSHQCSKEVHLLFKHLIKRELWAWRYIDAWGKLPAGVSNLHLTSYGDFEMCRGLYKELDIGGKTQIMRGTYCSLEFKVQTQIQHEKLVFLVGFCVPQACTLEDVDHMIESLIGEETLEHSVYCHQPKHMDGAAISTLLLMFTVISIAVVATTLDFILPEGRKEGEGDGHCVNSKTSDEVQEQFTDNGSDDSTDIRQLLPKPLRHHDIRKKLWLRLLLCFSLKLNYPKMFNISGKDNVISCINGIRVITIIWIINSHVIAYHTNSSANSFEYGRMITGEPFSQFLFQGSLSTDTFLIISGLLGTYGLLTALEKTGGKMQWLTYVIHRVVRLAPPFYMAFLFAAFCIKYLDDAPAFRYVDHINAECHKHWWKALLFINNFFKGKCQDWAWYVAVDLQLYLISPLFIIPLYKKPVVGFVLITLAFISSCGYAIYRINTCHYKPSRTINVIHEVDPKCNDEWDDIYVAPHVRCPAYLIGMVAGYILYRTKMTLNLRKLWIAVIWSVCTCLFLLLMFGLLPYGNMTKNSIPMSDALSTAYVSMYRPTWAIWISWLVIACATGNGGLVNSFLSLPIWKPFARVTYCVYLLHTGLAYFDFASHRVAFNMSNVTICVKTSAMVLLSFLLAFPYSMIFECPFLNLRKLTEKNK